MDEQPDNDAPRQSAEKLQKTWERALKRFDATVQPQLEIRAHGLLCRRFISIPGAMWDGPWGDQFENSIKVEIDKLSKGVDKIITDYRQNRIAPDFRPAGGDGLQETASTLDGLHRADSYHFKAQQARDNAFEEAVSGGMGAYRLKNEWADPYDKDSDEQRINPGLTIVDADQRVFFDGNSKLYDKSDARFCFVTTAMTRDAFEEEYPDAAADWPEQRLITYYDFFTPDVVVVCEYYEKEDRDEKLLIFTHLLTEEEQRWWATDIDADEIAEMEAKGYRKRVTNRKRCRVRKYTMSGAEVLKDHGYIAGDCIPVVPVYGKRWFVDNQERFRGYVSKLMDAQRIYNAKVSGLSETDALAPREKPIFAASQMPAPLAELWARQEIERHPYALVDPLIDPITGQIISTGPLGYIKPPDVAPVTAALLQIANADLMEESADGADEVKANTSAEAMDIAATRVDAKSGIYLDNMRQSVQREGEIYLSMAGEVYYEAGRVVETMGEDESDGEAVLQEAFTDDQGRYQIRNDFTRGKYKVIASVTEATATKRDKTVKASLNTAQIASAAQDMELAQIAILTAVMSQDGEGMDDMQAYARKRLVGMGVVPPNEEEKRAMDAAAENEQPDPMAEVAQAQAQALQAQAGKDMASIQETATKIELNKAKVIDTLASAAQKGAQAMQPANDAAEEMQPRIRRGNEQDFKRAG